MIGLIFQNTPSVGLRALNQGIRLGNTMLANYLYMETRESAISYKYVAIMLCFKNACKEQMSCSISIDDVAINSQRMLCQGAAIKFVYLY